MFRISQKNVLDLIIIAYIIVDGLNDLVGRWFRFVDWPYQIKMELWRIMKLMLSNNKSKECVVHTH